MTTRVLACPKCRLPVRLREGESTVQCSGCGTTVTVGAAGQVVSRAAGGGDRVRQAVLSASLVVVAVGFASMGLARRHGGGRAPKPTTSATPTPVYTAPPADTVAPTPEGELAWESNARSPVVARINADDVEDVFGFFRIWDGRSAWIPYAGAFDGATLKPLWQTEVIDSQLIKRPGVFPFAVLVGQRMVVADTSATLRVYKLATGEKELSMRLPGPAMDVCRSPDQPSRVWVRIFDGGDMMLDLDTSKSDAAPRPKWCPEPGYQAAALVPPSKKLRPTPAEQAALDAQKAVVTACQEAFVNSRVAQATCHVPAIQKWGDGFVESYDLDNGGLWVALGTKDGRPFAESMIKTSPWTHAFLADDTNARDLAPKVVDVAFGRIYAVYERVYFDARLVALDAKTGAVLWETPLQGSLPTTDGDGRGEARALVASAARVYVARSGGGLDIFDASSGKPVGSIGKQ